LKKERPELVNQAEVMNIVNQKTRKFEDSLQQFNVREQRLRESVDQFHVTIKAVQTNIDAIKHESGGAGITEDVMRSWVSHFFNEQIGMLKKDIQTDFNNVTEKIHYNNNEIQKTLEKMSHNSKESSEEIQNEFTKVYEKLASVIKNNDFKTLEANLQLLEKKFQNTLQNIFESVTFVYGTVVEEVAIYEKSDKKAKEICKAQPGDKLLLCYPIFKDGNNRWMKTRTVDAESAQLAEGWVPVFFDDTVFVNSFHL
jgi:phage shock protein A